MNKEELVYKYFQKTIDSEELVEFERLLLEDYAFKKQVELERQTKEAIISIKKDELKHVLRQAEKETSGKKRLPIFWAASIVIGLGFLTLFWLNGGDIDNKELYTAYFEVYPNIIAPPVRGSDSISEIQKDFMPYERRDFKSASTIFEQRFEDTNAPYYLFYQGVSELELGHTNKAISILEKHKAYRDRFESYSNWYLALAYLKMDDLEKSKILLSNIIAQQTYNHSKAKELLQQLE